MGVFLHCTQLSGEWSLCPKDDTVIEEKDEV
jgi:hypothetical protein